MKFPRYANDKYRCKKCGSILEICALAYSKKDAEPCLVCTGKSCGALYSPDEYGLTNEMMRDGQ